MPLSTLADEVLAEVEGAARVKAAELAAVRAVAPSHETEIGCVLHKVAEAVRADTSDVTYADLDQFMRRAS